MRKQKSIAKSAVSAIPQAVEDVRSQKPEISSSQLLHLQRVCADVEQAEKNLQAAIAQQQTSAGARQSFMLFLVSEYAMGSADIIDLQTGKINRLS